MTFRPPPGFELIEQEEKIPGTSSQQRDFSPLPEGFELIEESLPQAKRSGPPIDLTRTLGSASARAVESVLGAPREVGDFLQSLQPRGLIQKGAEKIGLGKGAEKLLSFTEKYSPRKLLPTTEDVRRFTRRIFGDTLEPGNPVDEKIGDLFGEFSTFVLPVGGQVRPLRGALTVIGANSVKEGLDLMGASKKTSELAKLGSYVIGSLIQPRAAKNYYTENYKLARSLLPEDATYASKSLTEGIEGLERQFAKGGISSAEKPALEQLRNLKQTVQGAQVPIDDLTEFKVKLNTERGNLRKLLEGNRPGIRRANRNMDMVANLADETLEEYAKANPEWGKAYTNANNAFAATKSSEKVAKFLQRNVKKLGLSHLGLAAVLGHLGGLSTLGKAGVAAAGTYPLYKAGQILTQIMKSPELAKEFMKLYSAALRESLPEVSKSAQRLEKELQKEKSSQ